MTICQTTNAKKYAISIWGIMGNDLQDFKHKNALKNKLEGIFT